MNSEYQKLNVILGGTFDPPHIGHDQMLECLLRDPRVQKVFVVPAYQNPLKNYEFSDEAGKRLGSPADRLRWVNLWVNSRLMESQIDCDRANVEAVEIEKPKPSFTVDTLNWIQEKYPSQKWVLALGSDQLPTFDKWKDFTYLLQQLESVWVFKRGNPLSWEKILDQTPQSVKERASIRFMSQHIVDVSSTAIRSALRKQDSQFLMRFLRPEIFKMFNDFHS